MESSHLSSRSIPRSFTWNGVAVACLKLAILGATIVLADITYDAILADPSSKSRFQGLMAILRQPRYLPALVPLLLIPLTPLLRRHLRWLFLPCLIAGLYVNRIQWQDLELFHRSHRIKLHMPLSISTILKNDEDDFLKQCVAPFFDMRTYLEGATVIFPVGTAPDLDGLRLRGIARAKQIERVPFDSEISRPDLEKFASRPGARYFQYVGVTDKDKGYIFIVPNPSKVYRVYTSERNLVFAEEGYVIK